MPPSPDIHLSLTAEEANHVLNALGEQPYNQVALIIQKIFAQMQACLNPATATAQGNGGENPPGAET